MKFEFYYTFKRKVTIIQNYNAILLYRFLRSLREFLRSQAARREPPLVWVNLRPFPSPLEDLPAVVSPRNSRCFWTFPHIQLILGSLVIALWWISIMMTS